MRATHASAIAERLRLALQVTDAVQHAHSNLVVHRIQPSNILVTEKREVKLLDSALRASSTTPRSYQDARLRADAGVCVAGTGAGRARLDLRRRLLSGRAYELLSGRHPFASGLLDITTAIVEHEPPKPSTVAVSAARQLAEILDTIC